MRVRHGAVLALLAFAAGVSTLPAADVRDVHTPQPVVRAAVKSGDTIQVPAGGYADLSFPIPEGAQAIQRVRGTITQQSKDLPPGRMIFAGTGTVTVETTIIDWKKQSVDALDFTVVFGTPPPPVPPTPPGPGPQPPTPNPDPLTSFRVIVVFESGDTLTPAMRAIVYGKVVEDWLNTNCTGGKAGWRRRDKDAPGENDATMAALWTAAKGEATATPCMIVARNNRVRILALKEGDTPKAVVDALNAQKEK